MSGTAQMGKKIFSKLPETSGWPLATLERPAGGSGEPKAPMGGIWPPVIETVKMMETVKHHTAIFRNKLWKLRSCLILS